MDFEHLLVVLPFCHKCFFYTVHLYFKQSSKVFAVIDESVVIHGFFSGLSLFSFITEPSGKNPVGLQLSGCSGHLFLVLFLPDFLHTKLQFMESFFCQ